MQERQKIKKGGKTPVSSPSLSSSSGTSPPPTAVPHVTSSLQSFLLSPCSCRSLFNAFRGGMGGTGDEVSSQWFLSTNPSFFQFAHIWHMSPGLEYLWGVLLCRSVPHTPWCDRAFPLLSFPPSPPPPVPHLPVPLDVPQCLLPPWTPSLGASSLAMAQPCPAKSSWILLEPVRSGWIQLDLVGPIWIQLELAASSWGSPGLPSQSSAALAVGLGA